MFRPGPVNSSVLIPQPHIGPLIKIAELRIQELELQSGVACYTVIAWRCWPRLVTMSVFCYSDVRGGIVLSQEGNREQALALRKLCIRDSAKLTWKSWLTLCSTRLSPSCQRQHNALTAVKQDQFQSRQVILSPKNGEKIQKSCLQSIVLLWAVLVAFTTRRLVRQCDFRIQPLRCHVDGTPCDVHTTSRRTPNCEDKFSQPDDFVNSSCSVPPRPRKKIATGPAIRSHLPATIPRNNISF